MTICIIDYGTGNIASVQNAFKKIEVNSQLSAEIKDWVKADALVLPGVGAFGRAMTGFENSAESLKDILNSGKPFLGICLGMQLLLEQSDESPSVRGLEIVKGNVLRFKGNLIIPHIGWNSVEPVDSCPLFEGMERFYAYFVHSYYCAIEEKQNIAAYTEYGIEFASALWKNNIYATQFHPEKSGRKGLELLRNFINVVRR